jgi:hypothetical protein
MGWAEFFGAVNMVDLKDTRIVVPASNASPPKCRNNLALLRTISGAALLITFGLPLRPIIAAAIGAAKALPWRRFLAAGWTIRCISKPMLSIAFAAAITGFVGAVCMDIKLPLARETFDATSGYWLCHRIAGVVDMLR